MNTTAFAGIEPRSGRSYASSIKTRHGATLRRQLAQAKTLSREMLNAFSEIFNVTLPPDPLEITVFDDEYLLGLHAYGRIGLSNSVLHGSIPTFELTLAHEIAHHGWRYVEINDSVYREGLAEFCAILVLMRLRRLSSARLGLHFCKARILRALMAGRAYSEDAQLYGVAPLAFFASLLWRHEITLTAIKACLKYGNVAPLSRLPGIRQWLKVDPLSVAGLVVRESDQYTWIGGELPGFCLVKRSSGVTMVALRHQESVRRTAVNSSFQPCPTVFDLATPDLLLLQRSLDASRE